MIYAVNLNASDGHKAGRFLLKYGLLKEYGIDLSACTVLKNKHGKPYLKEYPDIFFNISHCSSSGSRSRMAVCVFGNSSVGIDIEAKRPFSERLLKKVLSSEEYNNFDTSDELGFLKYWTLKEAYGKAKGVGMLYDYANTNFFHNGRIICPDAQYRVWQQIFGEIVISVCRKQCEDFVEHMEVLDMYYNELEE